MYADLRALQLELLQADPPYKSAIALAHDDGAHGYSKHICIKYHFVPPIG